MTDRQNQKRMKHAKLEHKIRQKDPSKKLTYTQTTFNLLVGIYNHHMQTTDINLVHTNLA